MIGLANWKPDDTLIFRPKIEHRDYKPDQSAQCLVYFIKLTSRGVDMFIFQLSDLQGSSGAMYVGKTSRGVLQ